MALIIGYIGAVFTTLASLPQLVKVLQTKSAEDVSFLMLLIFFIGNIPLDDLRFFNFLCSDLAFKWDYGSDYIDDHVS